MNLEELYEYCMSKKGTTEHFPFDDSVLVFKVGNKMYALSNIHEEIARVNLKCDPERALELREEHEEIIPGYHMSKKHWNTVIIGEGNLSKELILSLIDDSYDLIFQSLTKKVQQSIHEGS